MAGTPLSLPFSLLALCNPSLDLDLDLLLELDLALRRAIFSLCSFLFDFVFFS